MATFVLVHGSWHGAWCWHKLIPLLEQKGHRVVASDLAGLGADNTPPSEVTLDTWTEQVAQLLDDQPEPVVLVGHSRGGIVISQVAEARPDRVGLLVYLAAFLLRDGESLIQVAQTDAESRILPNLVVDEAAGVHTVRTGAAREIFYHDCSDEDVAFAVVRLRPEPNAPTFTPLRLTDARFGRVPRAYVACRHDRAVGPALQARMRAALPCRTTVELDTGHSPFFSAPTELAEQLSAIVGESAVMRTA
jgi:pimeloyl-ACP methyl ester carboxylesterase